MAGLTDWHTFGVGRDKVSCSDWSGGLVCTLDIQCEFHGTIRTEVLAGAVLKPGYIGTQVG